MAKSERKSKWKRKFRAIKRERNGKKELLILNKVLEIKNAADIEVDQEPKVEDETMQQGEEGTKSVYNSRTKLDKNGNYPSWMNSRAIKKIKTQNKRLKKEKQKV